jgi:uncharacterized protein (TIGR03086 family)
VEITDALERTFQHAHGVSAGVRPEQYDDKTPCDEWNVRDLLEHMIGAVAGLGNAAAGRPGGEFTLAADPAEQFGAVSAETLAAWRRPGVLGTTIEFGPGPMPGAALANINLIDTATHTWDLAKATGQDTTLPDDVAVPALEASRAFISPEIRRGRFAPKVEAPAGAGPTEQLVAYLGRTP